MSQHKLILAEKPSVAQSLATVLGVKTRKDGHFEGNGYLVTWCFGHLVELAQPNRYDEKYAKWRTADLPILPKTWLYEVPKDKKKQFNIVKSLLRRNDIESVVCATDSGREGELIFRLVYEQSGCKKPIQRLWISSMEESAIAEGFRNLKPGDAYENLYHAALCRSQADWLIGINATRLFSTLYGDTLSVGRVQTPTLAMLVKRESDISSFVKEPFYVVEIAQQEAFSLLDEARGGLVASCEKMKDKQQAEALRADCDGKSAVIRSVERKEKSISPPRLYDLTTLQREANRLFGYTAQQTLDAAQVLYERRCISYPRTDSRFLTSDMAAGLPALVASVAAALPLAKGLTVPVNAQQVLDDAKVSDHFAIIPTLSMPRCDLAEFSDIEQNILTMIATRLLCAVGEKHVFAETTVTLSCGDTAFNSKGKAVLQMGWKAIDEAFHSSLKAQTKENDESEPSLDVLAEGQTIPDVKATVREGFSQPPKHFTEDTLLSAMENAGADEMPEDAERKGLGTPATRAGIIEKLVKSQLIARKQKQLLPTEKGISLISVLPDSVKSPLLTAAWEHQLKQIERGEMTALAFMDGIADMIGALVRENQKANAERASLFRKGAQGKSIGTCRRCGKSVVEIKKGFVCESRECGFAIWKDSKFFTSKKKMLDAKTASALLKEGRIFMPGLFSEKSGKTYDATILLDDQGKYVNFKMEFSPSKKGAK